MSTTTTLGLFLFIVNSIHKGGCSVQVLVGTTDKEEVVVFLDVVGDGMSRSGVQGGVAVVVVAVLCLVSTEPFHRWEEEEEDPWLWLFLVLLFLLPVVVAVLVLAVPPVLPLLLAVLVSCWLVLAFHRKERTFAHLLERDRFSSDGEPSSSWS